MIHFDITIEIIASFNLIGSSARQETNQISGNIDLAGDVASKQRNKIPIA